MIDMNISGINSYYGFYDYNSIKSDEAKQAAAVSVEMTAGRQEQLPQQTGTEQKPEQNFTAADYAKGYQPDAEYGLQGADSDIYKLDVTQAISDMRKDQVLQQYQFFVGESRAQEGITAVTMNGQTARGVEDFSL